MTTKSAKSIELRSGEDTSDDSNRNDNIHRKSERGKQKHRRNHKEKDTCRSRRSRVNKEKEITCKEIEKVASDFLEEEQQKENEAELSGSNIKKRKSEEIENCAVKFAKTENVHMYDDITNMSDNSKSSSSSASESSSISSDDATLSISEVHSQSPKSKKETEVAEEMEIELDENLPIYYPAIDGCRSVEEFQCLNRVEEGTYGVVYRAKDKRTKEIVALKRLKMENEKEGFPITSLREINTLLKGQHENVVTLREVVIGNNMEKIFIVMDFIEHDLKSLIEIMKHRKQTFTIGEVKCLLKQLLCAVAHLHDNWILHRDLKTSNLLLSHTGILKVGDFGLAREYGAPVKPYTQLVVTLWYRAPELLLGTKEYSTAIDMWSVGCIFGELLSMNPVFAGKSEIDQINKIFKLLGTPNEKIWSGFNQLPACQIMKFAEYRISNLRSRFYLLGEIGLSLIQKFFVYDPAQRIDAEDALEHSYFSESPVPIDPSMFPTWPAKSEIGHRRAFANPETSSDSLNLENERVPMGGGFCLRF